jgi:hypothetical protein
MTTNQHVVSSEWTPLGIAAFRAIWFASLAANIGTWFQNVGGVWLMTRFTADVSELRTQELTSMLGKPRLLSF